MNPIRVMHFAMNWNWNLIFAIISVVIPYCSFYFFVPTHDWESIVFGWNVQNRDFDGFNGFEILWFRKSHFLQLDCLSLPLFVSMYFIIITQKHIIANTSNLVFCICIICRCYLKLFMKVEQIVCLLENAKELQI